MAATWTDASTSQSGASSPKSIRISIGEAAIGDATIGALADVAIGGAMGVLGIVLANRDGAGAAAGGVSLGWATHNTTCWPELATRRSSSSSLGLSSNATPLIESTMSPTNSSFRSSSTSCASEMCSSRMVPSPGE